MRHLHLPLVLVLAACGKDPVQPPADDSDVVVDPGPMPEAAPAAPLLRRLTTSQYDQVLRDLFGDDLYVPNPPEPDLRLDGLLRLGSAEVSVSPRGVERYEQAAYVIAEQAVEAERRTRWAPCEPSGEVDEACTREALAALGRLAWRRPLASAELDQLVAVTVNAEQVIAANENLGEPFWGGMQYGIAAILQAPEFLMRPELGEEAEDGTRRPTSYELASRLSFFLWDSIPDAALLQAAEDGVLNTTEGLAAEVDRMIADPRARRGLRAWTDDLLRLEDLYDQQKDPDTFIYLRDNFFDAAREETFRSVEDVVFDRDDDFGEILTTRRTFLDRTLSMIYGVRAPEREGFGATELPAEGQRVGLLGQASILALNAHPASSSATLRGKFVRTALLCGEVPPPPANVDTSIPEPSPDAPTLRDRIAAHLEVSSCRTCHLNMDPIGLGMENFDGLGVWRETEGGATIDASGDLDGAPFQDLPSLAAAVRAHDDFVPCMVKQVTRAALGRNPSEGEAETMEWLVQRFEVDEHKLKALWKQIALSPMIRTVGEVSP